MKPAAGCPEDNSCAPSKARSNSCERELRDICLSDQKELELCHDQGGCNSTNLPRNYTKHVSERIRKIEKLVSSGCMKNAEDYAAAAVVLLHSDTTSFKPQSYLQAFKFAQKALELGDECHRRYIAFGIRKNLAAKKLGDGDYSVAFLPLPNGCQCYSLRSPTGGSSLERSLVCQPNMKTKIGQTCLIKACNADPKSIPKNSIPGIW